MDTEMGARLVKLQAEYKAGAERLAALDRERETLVKQMLRIDGAIHVLKEFTMASAPAPLSESEPDPTAEA
jgi:predicted nuclease with TOPRIM domain